MVGPLLDDEDKNTGVKNWQKTGAALLLLLLPGPAGFAQPLGQQASQPIIKNLQGAWYGLAPVGLIEMAIGPDSLRIKLVDVKQADLSLAARYPHAATVPVGEVVDLGDRYLWIARQGTDTISFSALVLFDFVPGHHFQLAWNAVDARTRSPQTLVQLHTEDRRKLFGGYYYSARFINTLRSLRPVEEMTKPEFDRFFARYAEKVRQATREFEAAEPTYRFKFANQLGSYNYTLNTQALYEEGFCPLLNEDIVQALYRRFYSEKQISKKISAILKQ